MNGARARTSKKEDIFPFCWQGNLYRIHFPLISVGFFAKRNLIQINIFEEKVMLPVISRFWGEHVSLNAVICAILVFKKPKVGKRKKFFEWVSPFEENIIK